MATSPAREQLAARAIAAKYTLFVGLGSALALLGSILFVVFAMGKDSDRAWQLFHVNWVYFTGLTAGSFAFVAVQKVTPRKVVRRNHPLRRGRTVLLLPRLASGVPAHLHGWLPSTSSRRWSASVTARRFGSPTGSCLADWRWDSPCSMVWGSNW